MNYLAVLGRQPKISLAELIALFGEVKQLKNTSLAEFKSDKTPEIDRLGGSLKIAEKLTVPPLVFLQKLPDGKITLGISDYSEGANTRQVEREALKLKKTLVKQGRKVRVLENKTPVISTATAHHNKIGAKRNHVELIRYGKNWYSVVGVQNITAYAKRDQARPARDAKVGMLPPKLAQILINLCGELPQNARLLDPFCGTGVVLQEASLMNHRVYGTDLSPRMVEYTEKNLKWLANLKSTPDDSANISKDFVVEIGDAVTHKWQQPINAVAAETYLGPPMSNPPAEVKLRTVKAECKSLILAFLKNLANQLEPGTPVTIAIPAWLRPDSSYSRLNLLDETEKLGYNVTKYKTLSQTDLLYHRDGQIVAREIIILRKA